ncbi:MAG: hypothetical protein AAB724_00345 [Patescibacteria group bacterium]
MAKEKRSRSFWTGRKVRVGVAGTVGEPAGRAFFVFPKAALFFPLKFYCGQASLLSPCFPAGHFEAAETL